MVERDAPFGHAVHDRGVERAVRTPYPALLKHGVDLEIRRYLPHLSQSVSDRHKRARRGSCTVFSSFKQDVRSGYLYPSAQSAPRISPSETARPFTRSAALIRPFPLGDDLEHLDRAVRAGDRERSLRCAENLARRFVSGIFAHRRRNDLQKLSVRHFRARAGCGSECADSVHLIARAVREVKLHVLRRDLLGVGGKRVVLLLSGKLSRPVKHLAHSSPSRRPPASASLA